MLDIRKIKENPDAVKAGLKAKEVDCDAVIDRILELDVQIRGLKTASEGRTAQKNKIAKENGKLFGQKKGMEKKLYRNTQNKMIAGVCSGLAEYTNIDPTIIRLIWALVGLSGAGVLAYLIAALIIPEKPNNIIDA